MDTVLITHPDCLGHKTPEGHPEQVARLTYVLKALDDLPLSRAEAPQADDEVLLRCHPQEYIDRIAQSEPTQGTFALDPDTHMSPGSHQAARRAAGGAVKAVDMVLGGQAAAAFVATRPPGHHAERATPMGFCLFGNVALAAKHALDHHGLSRVAIVDFDVHHGNGTQDLCQNDRRILFCSTHQMPLYPGTGHPNETGIENNVLNLPMEEGAGGLAFRAAFDRAVLPALRNFLPELIIISAGFDAHRHDPLAGLSLDDDDFAWMTRELCTAAAELCDGRVVSCLEGGYNLDALGRAVRAHVTELMEHANGR